MSRFFIFFVLIVFFVFFCGEDNCNWIVVEKMIQEEVIQCVVIYWENCIQCCYQDVVKEVSFFVDFILLLQACLNWDIVFKFLWLICLEWLVVKKLCDFLLKVVLLFLEDSIFKFLRLDLLQWDFLQFDIIGVFFNQQGLCFGKSICIVFYLVCL